MLRRVLLTTVLLLSGCSASSEGRRPNCATRPSDFLSWKESPANVGGARWIEAPHKNTIHLDRNDELSWNGAKLGGLEDTPQFAVVNQYLRQVAQLAPRPLTTITFDKGASCGRLERLRAVVRMRLDCSQSRTCFQGYAPDYLN